MNRDGNNNRYFVLDPKHLAIHIVYAKYQQTTRRMKYFMEAKVQKWGNSLALRIPKAFVESTQLTKGSVVDLSLHDGQIVIEPKSSSRYTLDELLRNVTIENIHEEMDAGPFVGKEFW